MVGWWFRGFRLARRRGTDSKERLGPEKSLENGWNDKLGACLFVQFFVRKVAWVRHTSVFTGHLFAQAGRCFFWYGEQCAELPGCSLLLSCLGLGGNLFSIAGGGAQSHLKW